jgi:hypothetical protein
MERRIGISLTLTLFVLLALGMTHPLWLHLAHAVPGDIGDPLLNTWILAWDIHALLTDPGGLFDANIFYPLPNTLAYSEHLLSSAALILPLALVSGQPVVAYNLSLLLSFPLAGLGMYLLILGWTGCRRAALLAGIAFAFTPYRLASIAHLQLLTIQWLPFSLLALDRVLKSQITNHKSQITNRKPQGPARRAGASVTIHWLLLIVFTTLQVLASWYLAVFTGLVLGLYVLSWLGGRLLRQEPEPAWRKLAELVFAMVLVAGLTLPFVLPYLASLPQLAAARPPSVAASFRARPTDFLTAAPYLRFAGPVTKGWSERYGFTEENALFVGIVALLLAILGLVGGFVRSKAGSWRVGALTAILAVSLALTFDGQYFALMDLLPALRVVRVPARWIIPTTFALASLAGLGAAQVGRHLNTKHERARRVRFSDVAWVLLLLLLLVESFAAPLPLAKVESTTGLPPVYFALRERRLAEPGRWAVLELPMHVAPEPEYPETKRMYASTLGWWGLVNGYSGFSPKGQMELAHALSGFPAEEALKALSELGLAGVRYLVLHPGEAPLDRTRWETVDRWQVERGTSLLPVGSFGPDDLYLINPYGDELITQPESIADPYWSAHAPRPVGARFALPGSDAEIQLLANLPTFQAFPRGDLRANLPRQTRLTLYWQTSTSLDRDYTVFVHSLDADGVLIGQADGPPVANHYPTSLWQPGEIVQDSRLIPAGDRYLVGLYDPLSGERLPALGADGIPVPDNAVVLAMDGR